MEKCGEMARQTLAVNNKKRTSIEVLFFYPMIVELPV